MTKVLEEVLGLTFSASTHTALDYNEDLLSCQAEKRPKCRVSSTAWYLLIDMKGVTALLLLAILALAAAEHPHTFRKRQLEGLLGQKNTPKDEDTPTRTTAFDAAPASGDDQDFTDPMNDFFGPDFEGTDEQYSRMTNYPGFKVGGTTFGKRQFNGLPDLGGLTQSVPFFGQQRRGVPSVPSIPSIPNIPSVPGVPDVGGLLQGVNFGAHKRQLPQLDQLFQSVPSFGKRQLDGLPLAGLLSGLGGLTGGAGGATGAMGGLPVPVPGLGKRGNKPQMSSPVSAPTLPALPNIPGIDSNGFMTSEPPKHHLQNAFRDNARKRAEAQSSFLDNSPVSQGFDLASSAFNVVPPVHPHKRGLLGPDAPLLGGPLASAHFQKRDAPPIFGLNNLPNIPARFNGASLSNSPVNIFSGNGAGGANTYYTNDYNSHYPDYSDYFDYTQYNYNNYPAGPYPPNNQNNNYPPYYFSREGAPKDKNTYRRRDVNSINKGTNNPIGFGFNEDGNQPLGVTGKGQHAPFAVGSSPFQKGDGAEDPVDLERVRAFVFPCISSDTYKVIDSQGGTLNSLPSLPNYGNPANLPGSFGIMKNGVQARPNRGGYGSYGGNNGYNGGNNEYNGGNNGYMGQMGYGDHQYNNGNNGYGYPRY
ncbi:hypothetical protein PROFUN_13689 [Planoprotostelium fungivorum]|uniref:Uncharacterized protein n=1 Tax=Planoprotostelium fungivorum TaxID=1890364 RepID=A0A2P6N3C3_9EUKA|nr:hypothetical protein PROFUN_13689 [Planoprotostelium fungivorum]